MNCEVSESVIRVIVGDTPNTATCSNSMSANRHGRCGGASKTTARTVRVLASTAVRAGPAPCAQQLRHSAWAGARCRPRFGFAG